MIFSFSPGHWNIKWNWLPRTFQPSSQMVGTDNARGPRYILVTYSAPKAKLKCFLKKWCYSLYVKLYSTVPAHGTKTVYYIIYTPSSHNETLYSFNHCCKHTEVLERTKLLRSSVVLVMHELAHRRLGCEVTATFNINKRTIPCKLWLAARTSNSEVTFYFLIPFGLIQK